MSTARPLAVLALGLSVAACSSSSDQPAARDVEITSSSAPTREQMTPAIETLVAAGRFKGELWRMNLSERYGEPVVAHRVSVDGDLLIIEDTRNRIHALHRETGIHAWPLDLDGPTTQSVGGTPSTATFVSTDELVGVERRTGSRRQTRASQHIGFFPSGRALTIGTSAYIGRLAPPGVQSINLTAGNDGWEYQTKGSVVDLVAYGDGALAQLIGATEDGLLFSLPPRPASESSWAPPENWFRRLPGTNVVTPLSLLGNDLAFGGERGFLYHVDARSGQILWKVPCGDDLRGNEPTIAGDAIFARSSGTLHAFAKDSGHELWTVEGGHRLITRVGENCYVDMGDGNVSVRKSSDGVEVANFSTAGFRFVPTVPGGGFFFACDGENVIAVQ